MIPRILLRSRSPLGSSVLLADPGRRMGYGFSTQSEGVTLEAPGRTSSGERGSTQQCVPQTAAGFRPEPHSPISHTPDPRTPVGAHLAGKCDQQLSGGGSSAISLSTRLLALPLKLLSINPWEGGGDYCRHLEQSLWQEWAPGYPVLSSSGMAGITDSCQSSVPSFLLHSGVDVAFTQETRLPVISAGDVRASSCHPDTTVPFFSSRILITRMGAKNHLLWTSPGFSCLQGGQTLEPQSQMEKVP